eukprot:CAMPEP_0181371646 /NCGR_PEP_ID=MMETSP1106-20121128/14227_1 /TAXON_ID=81844 /ORGANISM="Mantoniella antarctica, Strain SL-175" /LENGTH=216 /DNA_ID=CAMNT_0023488833 /DNA_START=112 /DNA_END=759 /DNA_ORIENTATION=-
MRLRALLGNGEMSSFQFARYKARKEESGNTLTERCARWNAAAAANSPAPPSPAPYSESRTQTAAVPQKDCPCRWFESAEAESGSIEQEAGCAFVPYEEMEKSSPSQKYQQWWVLSGCIFAFFMMVQFLIIYVKWKRDERAREVREQTSIEMAGRIEVERRKATHSGKRFVSVEQPCGETELAEVMIVSMHDSLKPSSASASLSNVEAAVEPPHWAV